MKRIYKRVSLKKMWGLLDLWTLFGDVYLKNGIIKIEYTSTYDKNGLPLNYSYLKGYSKKFGKTWKHYVLKELVNNEANL